MKKLLNILIFSLLIINTSFASDNQYNDNKLDDKYTLDISSLKGRVFSQPNEIKAILSEYLSVREEGNMDYVYNPDNNELVMYFKDGIDKLVVTDCKVTSQLTNVYMTVNEDIKLHVVYYNDTDNILDVRVRKYFPDWERYFEVVTEENK
ncbi:MULTISPECIES: hypothetical protein [Flammeovirga]|uniref:Uncharacterized protein n=1 Tax=Flammeovirga agarivorans TaxID=2726742 RepID=A0A7X8SNV6_9BACT|nr:MULTISPECIES: hypothetical protein [Flammeovirga]NLR93675.1 hypothetical protein [Flammeovirga agarivorans]